MKKMLFLLMALVPLSCSVSAQFISIYASDVNYAGSWRTVVRSWGSDYAVSFFVNVNGNPIIEVVEQSSGNTYWADLPSDVYIHDMYVDQQTGKLFFCGATQFVVTGGMYSCTGVIGWIELASFIPPSTNLAIEYMYVGFPGYGCNCINKLVEYDDGGLSHIMAIGEYRDHSGSYIYSRYYYVDCVDILSGWPSVEVTPFSDHERYDDVLHTDNYIVFVGYDVDPSVNSICYRRTDPYNIHNPMFDDIHPFYNGNDALSRLHSTAMIGDEFAASYLSINASGDFVTRTRVIDVANDINVNSQEFVLTDKTEPDDLVHIPADNSLVLMQVFYAPSGSHNSNFVFLDPYANAPYITNIEYKKDEYFQSLTMHDGFYYLAGDGASWFLRDKKMSPTGYPHGDCPIVEDLQLDIIDCLDAYLYGYPIGTPPNNEYTNPSQPMVNISIVNINCLNY